MPTLQINTMNTDKPIEAEVVKEPSVVGGMALAKSLAPNPTETNSATPQQMRVTEVNEALAPAYSKASTLEMTDAEIELLMSPFPDSVVEVRPHDGLIYIPHIHVSDRLNRVFKPGKWSMVCRRHWLEGQTMYGEYIMLIRGCYVGESVGGHPYQPNNPKVNYSDTLESTAAEALRRIAGKRLSCGWQVWDPSYAAEWCQKYRGQSNGKYFKKSIQNATDRQQQTPATPVPQATAKPKTDLKLPTDATRAWMIKELKAGPGEANRKIVCEYFFKCGQLLETEELETLPLRFVPYSKQKLEALISCISNFEAGGDVVRAFTPHVEEDKKPIEVPRDKESLTEDDAWRQFPMPWGNQAGTPMEDLEKNYLFGLWANYTVETEYNGRPKKPETIAKDTKFREMLDMCGQHYQFKKKD